MNLLLIKSTDVIIEICLDSPEHALDAQKNGADRVELCANLPEGGTTPSAGCIAATRAVVSIDLFVLIRPRSGHFYYSDNEVEQMKYDIRLCKKIGVDGVVIGLLKKDGSVDKENVELLIKEARPMSVTFHRAFDRCIDPLKALSILSDLGVNRILTSGQCKKAVEGKILLKALVEKAKDTIIIMPGSGINDYNIRSLAKFTSATEFHFSANKKIRSDDIFAHPGFEVDDYDNQIFDKKKLLNCIAVLNSI